MNGFGKSLVLAQTTLSLIFLTWACMVFFQFADFGWKEPLKIWDTKDSGKRVASKLDKETAALNSLAAQRAKAEPGMRPAIDVLVKTMEFFPKNRQFYVAALEEIRFSDAPIALKKITYKDGSAVLDVPKTGKPIMKDPIPDVTMSTKAYLKERDAIYDKIKALTPQIKDLVAQADDITIQLFGTKDDKGNSVDIGLYEVLDKENENQDKIREEKDYITPRYVDAQRRADAFRDRYGGMLKSLMSLVNFKK